MIFLKQNPCFLEYIQLQIVLVVVNNIYSFYINEIIYAKGYNTFISYIFWTNNSFKYIKINEYL